MASKSYDLLSRSRRSRSVRQSLAVTAVSSIKGWTKNRLLEDRSIVSYDTEGGTVIPLSGQLYEFEGGSFGIFTSRNIAVCKAGWGRGEVANVVTSSQVPLKKKKENSPVQSWFDKTARVRARATLQFLINFLELRFSTVPVSLITGVEHRWRSARLISRETFPADASISRLEHDRFDFTDSGAPEANNFNKHSRCADGPCVSFRRRFHRILKTPGRWIYLFYEFIAPSRDTK